MNTFSKKATVSFTISCRSQKKTILKEKNFFSGSNLFPLKVYPIFVVFLFVHTKAAIIYNIYPTY